MDSICSRFNVIWLLIVLCFFLSGNKISTEACDVADQAWQGCRIDNRACSCAFGCKSEFRYPNMQECLDALKGRTNDVCGLRPCLHKGTCIQVSQTPGYRCRCDGTGYWGNRCQRLCPTPSDNIAVFPYECIVI